MKGSDKIIALLNKALCTEYSAAIQYRVHAKKFDNDRYVRLDKFWDHLYADESEHAALLIERIIFLEGEPAVVLNPAVKIGKAPEEMINQDLKGEHDAIELYNEIAAEAQAVGDFETAKIVQGILSDETSHTDFHEAQLAQIKAVGIQQWLAEQFKSGEDEKMP